MKTYGAEFFGTFWLVLGGCGSAVLAAGFPVTNTSVNPARSTGVAVFVGDWAVSQLWLFWVAPILGGVLGALIYGFLSSDQD